MVPQCETSENISVNIYETGSFTKFDERDSDTNFFNDIIKSTTKVKPYLRSTLYFEKLDVLHVNIRSIKRNFENVIGRM